MSVNYLSNVAGKCVAAAGVPNGEFVPVANTKAKGASASITRAENGNPCGRFKAHDVEGFNEALIKLTEVAIRYVASGCAFTKTDEKTGATTQVKRLSGSATEEQKAEARKIVKAIRGEAGKDDPALFADAVNSVLLEAAQREATQRLIGLFDKDGKQVGPSFRVSARVYGVEGTDNEQLGNKMLSDNFKSFGLTAKSVKKVEKAKSLKIAA